MWQPSNANQQARTLLCRTVVRLLFLTLRMVPALAAAPALAVSDREPPVYALSIRSQPLDEALQEFALQSGVQVVFFARVTDRKQGGVVDGEYTIADAMSTLLHGTPLTYRVLNSRTIEVTLAEGESSKRAERVAAEWAARIRTQRRLPNSSSRAKPMQEVVIRATAEGVVATRTETPLREIPQTVSVVSLEQLHEQNLVNLGEAMERVPGVTTARDNSLDKVYYARGFPVTSYHIDGSPSLYWFRLGDHKAPDLAEFEQIEVLRGADGLFSGNGEPGASINLVRKRPRDEPAFRLDVWAGSWSNYRAEVDATGPLGFDGELRGRIVGVYHDQDSFYDAVTQNRKKLFGVLEYDIGPDTLLTLGGSYELDDDVPVMGGVQAKPDGSDPHVPRDKALTTDWMFQRAQTHEAYLKLQQGFGEDWKLRFGATIRDGSLEFGRGIVRTDFDAATGGRTTTGASATFTTRPNVRDQFNTELTLTGTFDLLGLHGELALGGDYARYKYFSAGEYYVTSGAGGSVSEYDPSIYADPRLTRSPLFSQSSRGQNKAVGAFAYVKLNLGDAWSVGAGARAGQERYWKRNTSSTGLISNAKSPWSTRTATPYAAVMYDVSEHYSLYASYADIYRDTSSDMLVLSWGSGYGENRLKPDGSDIGVRHGVNIESGIKAAWRDGRVNGTLVYYRIAQNRVPLLLPAGYPKGSVPGVSHSMGADLELSGTVAPGWLLGAGYTFNDNRKATGMWEGVRGPLYFNTELSRATAKHLFKAWTTKQLPGQMSRWAIGGDLRAQTSQVAPLTVCSVILKSGDCASNASSRILKQLNSYAVLDMHASFRLDRNWRVGLTANNVFDKWYYESLGNTVIEGWYGEPRNFMLKVEGAF